MKKNSLSTILAPIVAENARRAANAGPRPSQPCRIYNNIQPARDHHGNPFVAPYDAN